jgi:hypothetical protein
LDIFEITGYKTGVSRSGVNFLEPGDSFQDIENGFIYRQVLQSRQGIGYFAPRLAGNTRIFGIFEHVLPDGTKELLAADQNFLYRFNTGTGVFDQLAFAGSMAGYAGFNISAKDLYISGTSYPTATNTARFVFTGYGITANAAGSSVFFYDGTDVKDFTSLVDNPNYQAPLIGGVSTALNKAKYVIWFNERLNFISPTIGNVDYTQAILYSGIRTTSGNGDKFAVAGSGMLQADTYENINGACILGQVLVLNFYRSNWTAEKTKDAFNPYFIRKVPSVLGTDADFSSVSWDDTVKSIGKTGIISTDGRQSLRIDNKIPFFTEDEFDQLDFNLTYGGFDRINNQFMWTYKENEADTETQNKVLVYNYEEGTWSVFDQRLTVLAQTDIGLNYNWDDIYEVNNPSWAAWDTTEEIWDKIGIGQAVQKTLAGDDLGFIYDLNQDFDDYITTISTITPVGTTTVLAVAASGIQEGDQVVIQNVLGMTEINNYNPNSDETDVDFTPYNVTSATPTSITIDVDSSNYTPATPNTGTISTIIKFSAKTIPFNPYRDQGRRCYVSHVEFLIDRNGGSLKVDVFADEEEAAYKTNVLLLPSNETTKAREWITMIVDNEADFHTFKLKQESPAVQLRLTSMRIHCKKGGYTSG